MKKLKKDIVFSRVLEFSHFVIFDRPKTSLVTKIYLTNIWQGLATGFNLSINNFFNDFVLYIEVLLVIVKLSFNKRAETMSKVLNQDICMNSGNRVKFFSYCLQVFPMSRLIYDFFSTSIESSFRSSTRCC